MDVPAGKRIRVFPVRRTPGASAGAWVAGLNAPALALILGLVAYPVILSLWTSLHSLNLLRGDRGGFIGLGNYVEIVTSPDFWGALAVTVTFALVAVLFVLVLGVGFALLFHEEFRGRGLARALLLVPWAVPGVVNGLLWRGMFGKYGGINALLGGVHQFSVAGWQPFPWVPENQAWLSDPHVALFAVAMAHVWKEVPFGTVIFLASLQAIPLELHRAARVDGAGPWRRFTSVTLPWLLHPLLLVAIVETMNAFRTFDLIYTLTGGGPGRATNVIAYQTYIRAFRFIDFGQANAYSYLIAVMTMGLAALYVRLLYRRGTVQA